VKLAAAGAIVGLARAAHRLAFRSRCRNYCGRRASVSLAPRSSNSVAIPFGAFLAQNGVAWFAIVRAYFEFAVSSSNRRSVNFSTSSVSVTLHGRIDRDTPSANLITRSDYNGFAQIRVLKEDER
jgi:hypothetical protein